MQPKIVLLSYWHRPITGSVNIGKFTTDSFTHPFYKDQSHLPGWSLLFVVQGFSTYLESIPSRKNVEKDFLKQAFKKSRFRRWQKYSNIINLLVIYNSSPDQNYTMVFSTRMQLSNGRPTKSWRLCLRQHRARHNTLLYVWD